MRALFAAPTVVVLAAVTLVAYQAIKGQSSDGDLETTLNLDCGNRCAFELVYNTFNGHISGASAWDPTVPFSAQPGSSVDTREGEESLVFTDHPDARAIFEHPDRYYVDLESSKIRRGPNPQIDADAWPPVIPPASSPDHIAARTDGQPCSPHPCDGWRYAAIYRLSDRTVRWVTGFDPTGTASDDFPLDPGDGEALVELSDDPHLEDILALVLTGSADLLSVDEEGELIEVRGRHPSLPLPPREGSEGRQCHFNPCPGFVYEFRADDETGEGKSLSVYSCMSSQQGCASVGPFIEGVVRVDIGDDPLLPEVIHSGFDHFRLNLETGDLEPLQD
jgi:hypothetical protein